MQMLLSNTVQDIVNNSYNYTANVAENKYTDNVTAYNILKTDASILSGMADTNSKYQAFYNNIASGNIGAFEKVNNLILAGDYSDAQVLNSGISPANTMEINRQTVNDIYMNSWAAGRFDLTDDEYNTLYGIAAQQPVLGGSGVYSARVMVGEPVTNLSSARMMGGNNNNTTPKTNVIGLIYPDPVSDIANIDYAISTEDNLMLTVFGITGNKLMELKLDNKSQHYSFSTQQLKQGVYFYRIISGNNVISNNKFIIVK